jgi:hypothetical protein
MALHKVIVSTLPHVRKFKAVGHVFRAGTPVQLEVADEEHKMLLSLADHLKVEDAEPKAKGRKG